MDLYLRFPNGMDYLYIELTGIGDFFEYDELKQPLLKFLETGNLEKLDIKDSSRFCLYQRRIMINFLYIILKNGLEDKVTLNSIDDIISDVIGDDYEDTKFYGKFEDIYDATITYIYKESYRFSHESDT